MRRPWVTLSVLFNVFFISMIAVVALDERTETQREEDRLRVLIEPDCVEFQPEFLEFCRPRIGSELARIEPTTVYVSERGIERVRIEYEDENRQAIADIMAYDEFGRSWVNVDFQDGLISFDHYPDDARWDPDFSLIDRDLDGIPDQKVDWVLRKRFERVGEIIWRPFKKKDD